MDAKTTETPRPAIKETSLEDVVAEMNLLLATGRYDGRICVLMDARGKRHVLTYPVRVIAFVAQ